MSATTDLQSTALAKINGRSFGYIWTASDRARDPERVLVWIAEPAWAEALDPEHTTWVEEGNPDAFGLNRQGRGTTYGYHLTFEQWHAIVARLRRIGEDRLAGRGYRAAGRACLTAAERVETAGHAKGWI